MEAYAYLQMHTDYIIYLCMYENILYMIGGPNLVPGPTLFCGALLFPGPTSFPGPGLLPGRNVFPGTAGGK